MRTIHVMRECHRLEANMPSSNTVALIGSSSLFSWVASRFLQSSGLDHCAPLLQSAVAAAQFGAGDCNCELPEGPVEVEPTASWLHTLLLWSSGPHGQLFWAGVGVGTCLFPLIDLLFIAKEAWLRFVQSQVFARRARPAPTAHTYDLRLRNASSA